jgi:hypothetical protein
MGFHPHRQRQATAGQQAAVPIVSTAINLSNKGEKNEREMGDQWVGVSTGERGSRAVQRSCQKVVSSSDWVDPDY